MILTKNDMFHNCEIRVYDRPSYKFENLCHKYINRDRSFDRQFAVSYTARLKCSLPLLQKQVKNKWGSSSNVKQLSDILADEHVIVIGTIFKMMELHPTILKEISEEHNMIPQPVTEHYTSDDDYVILEDDTQRVMLCGNIDPHAFVTGVNIAVSGYTEESGKFFVEDVCHPFVANPLSYPVFTDDKYVLFISGLCFSNANVTFPLQTLIDLINGSLGSSPDHEKFSKLVRVIIAGNSIGQSLKDAHKTNILTRKSKASTIESVKLMDDFLVQLATSVDVDLMPGESDPTNHLMPQQSFHPCMFPRSSAYSTFHVVTNPYEACIDGVKLLGTSGQNIKDIQSYSSFSDTLDIMHKNLDWGHLLPTAPDTLNCYPFPDKDPFIITECPHIYFSGNASKIAKRSYDDKNVMMISIPKFVDTFSCLLLNLKTLEVEPLVVGEMAL
ncbi:DNA polymerase delta subunit 2 [Parasteatoda tepidariorum]|uniref:DNA polymerase delta subunit 2 n=1 Tax=Parasteatoda tepidariorum TaxID=114398 RepID=UPI00077FDB8A|nr:DNA polymerase delta subunit 2 [Parasteatoda tepidariorum]